MWVASAPQQDFRGRQCPPRNGFSDFPLWVSSEGMGSRLWVSRSEMLRAATKVIWVTAWIIPSFGQNREIMRK